LAFTHIETANVTQTHDQIVTLAENGGTLPLIPALRRQKKEDYEFDATLESIVSGRPAWDT
jgi:Flp pilus assembly protein CpaB